MSSNDIDARQAEGRIRLAIRRLADKYPFHCKVLEQFRLQERPAVGTTAVLVRGEDILLLYNADFVLKTPVDQLVGVLLHEVNHVVLGHVWANPADYPDQWARIVAEKITANEFVKEPLPEDAIQLTSFSGLRPMQSTDERYERLKRQVGRGQVAVPSGALLGERSNGCVGSTLDDHTVWQENEQTPEQSRATVESAVRDAVLEAGVDHVPDELQDSLRELGVGDTPGDGQYELAGDQQGHLDWRRLLRRYVGQIRQVRRVFRWPSRRFPDLVGIVPGKRRRPERPRVMAIIDTSGSVTPELLELIDAELTQLARQYTVLVVECDAKVHAVYEYAAPLATVNGRGGTDFRPPLTREFLRRHRPDLVVYFTDGFGPAPTWAPEVPVIWCLVPGGECPAAWDRQIQMDE